MTKEIRSDPSEVDAAWMTEVLERSGVARGAAVTDVVFEGYVGTGQMSRNARLRLTWSAGEGRPATLIGKFPSDDMPTRSSAFRSGAYENEYTFYTQLASTVQVRTPRCWAAGYDLDLQRAFLFLEDLAGSEQGDQLRGCTEEEVDLIVDQAVRLHAPRWGDRTLAAVNMHPGEKERSELTVQYYDASVSTCLARLGQTFSADVVSLIESFTGCADRWAAGTSTPRTIVHGDFRPDNLLFGRSPDAPPVAVVDWQTIHRGGGVTDIAYLLGGSFEPAVRREIERRVVEDYRDRLRTAGVTYSTDDCWHDYRWGSLQGVLISVCAATMAAQTERGDKVLALMAERHAQHAVDLAALELVSSER